MPGIFGGSRLDSNLHETLQDKFALPWGGCESKSLSNGILGGHAFRPAKALHHTCNGVYFAVDGEASIYREAQEFALHGRPTLFSISSANQLTLSKTCKRQRRCGRP